MVVSEILKKVSHSFSVYFCYDLAFFCQNFSPKLKLEKNEVHNFKLINIYIYKDPF